MLEDVFRDQWGRVLATLVGVLGDIELAEDAAQDRLEVVEVEYAPGDGSAQERFRPWWETDPELSARFSGTNE